MPLSARIVVLLHALITHKDVRPGQGRLCRSGGQVIDLTDGHDWASGNRRRCNKEPLTSF